MVAAMAAAVAPGGLLLMPSFNLVERKQRAQVWDVTSTPSTVGSSTTLYQVPTHSTLSKNEKIKCARTLR